MSAYGFYLDAVPFSGIIRIRDMMYTVDRPFRLDQGDVSFDAPESVKAALVQASHDNRTHYVQTTGIPPLLDLLVTKMRDENGIPVERADEVMVTSGGIHGVFSCARACSSPATKCWCRIRSGRRRRATFRARTRVPVGYPLHESRGWRPDVDEMRRLVTPKTRAIYVNSPNNPDRRRADARATSKRSPRWRANAISG